MHSAWYSIRLTTLLEETMKSWHGDGDTNLTYPETHRKIQIEEGNLHGSNLYAASSVGAGCMVDAWWLYGGEVTTQHGSCDQEERLLLCVLMKGTPVVISFLPLYISLSLSRHLLNYLQYISLSLFVWISLSFSLCRSRSLCYSLSLSLSLTLSLILSLNSLDLSYLFAC